MMSMSSSAPGSPALSWSRLAAYGAPVLGLSYLLFFLQFYFLKYATDVLLLAPAVVGAAMGFAKLWDAVSDPLVGSWSDRSTHRWGRRRPWMLAALVPLWVGFGALWSLPGGLGGPAMLGVSFAILLLFYTAFTAYGVPHGSLGAELHTDPHQRTRAFAARQMGWTVGLFLAFGAIQLARDASAPRESVPVLAWASGLAAVLALAIPPLVLREPVGHRGRGGRSLGGSWSDVLSNRHARLLLGVWFVENVGVGVLGSLAPFVVEYVVRRPDLIGVLPGVYVLAGLASLPLWVRASRRFGKRATWLVAMAAGGVGFGATAFAGPGSVALVSVALAIAGAGMGCGGALSSAVLADVIDADERRTGERKEGAYTAALSFALKAGIALSSAGAGIALGATGFVPNAEQSPSTLLGLKVLFAGLPALGFGLGAAMFWRFDLAACGRPGVYGSQPS